MCLGAIACRLTPTIELYFRPIVGVSLLAMAVCQATSNQDDIQNVCPRFK